MEYWKYNIIFATKFIILYENIIIMEIEYLYSRERDSELQELAKKLSTFKTSEELEEFVSSLSRKDQYELLSFIRFDTERLKYEVEKERERKKALLERKEELLKEREALEEQFERANNLLEVFGEKAFIFEMGKAWQ